MKFTTGLFLFTLLLKTSFAMSFCEIKGKVIQRAYYDESEITNEKACKNAKYIDGLLTKVTKIYTFAPRLSLKLVSEFDNASYDNGSLINIPLRFYSLNVKNEKVYKEQKDLDAIILHEYGHAILATYLATEWDGFYYYHQLGHRISSLKQKLFLNKSADTIKQLKETEEELMSARSMRTFTRAIIPYQELYADILSAFLLNDKKAISNSISTNEDSEELGLLYRARDFSSSPFDLGKLAFHPHAYFYKVRQYIGDNLWPENETTRNNILHKILYILGEEIPFSYYYSSFMSDPIIDNEELIARIQENQP